MDTRQLAAFCAVVERRSFSQAADRLGVTQPAVSLQVRALEKRLGAQLLDRSGRRVEPTEAGWRLYRGAQRMLALEDQLVADVAASGEGALAGDLVLGASTGPAAVAIPVALAEFQRLNPDIRVYLTVSDTHSVVERVAARELELGIVGAARGEAHPHAGRRGCPPGRRGRAAPPGRAAARSRREARARPAGVRPPRRRGGLRRHVHLAHCGRGRPGGRASRRGPCGGPRGHAPDLARVRDGPCPVPGRGCIRGVRPRAARAVIVRWGLAELDGLLKELGLERPLLVTSARFAELDIPV